MRGERERRLQRSEQPSEEAQADERGTDDSTTKLCILYTPGDRGHNPESRLRHKLIWKSESQKKVSVGTMPPPPRGRT